VPEKHRQGLTRTILGRVGSQRPDPACRRRGSRGRRRVHTVVRAIRSALASVRYPCWWRVCQDLLHGAARPGPMALDRLWRLGGGAAAAAAGSSCRAGFASSGYGWGWRCARGGISWSAAAVLAAEIRKILAIVDQSMLADERRLMHLCPVHRAAYRWVVQRCSQPPRGIFEVAA
jgi:hypothetical protein